MKLKEKLKNLVVIIGIMMLVLPCISYALPEGEVVVSGSASFERPSAQELNVVTPSEKLIVNYNSFSIAQNEAVKFSQPSVNSVVLNRVVGVDPSSISGSLSANGKVFLINPNGIMFNQGSRVDVAGLVASTLDITNEDFLKGNYKFYKNGSNSFIINDGQITAAPGGYVCLLAPGIKNTGLVQADLGVAMLASGQKMTLSLDDNNSVSVVVDEAVQEQVIGPDGQAMKSAIENTGVIAANGGKVILNAKVLNNVLDYSINNKGLVQAGNLVSHNGVLELTAEGAPVVNSGTLEAGTANIKVSNADFINTKEGKVLANGIVGLPNAGKIVINASSILQQGQISANALENGTAGEVEIVSESSTVLDEDSQTTASASAVLSGNGGRILINSLRGNTAVRKNAILDVSAGSISGNAGFIEVSAFSQLGFYGILNGRAPPGFTPAKIVFDPLNIVIQTGGTGSLTNPTGTPQESSTDHLGQILTIDPSVFSSLSGSLIWLQATNDITVNNALNLSSALKLEAGHNININADIISTQDVTLLAANTITVSGAKVKGENVTLTAHSNVVNQKEFAGGDPGETLNDLGLLNLSGPTGYAITVSNAEVRIKTGSTIEAVSAVTITANAEATAEVNALGFILGIAYSESTATANAIVENGATIKSGGLFKLEAIIDNSSTAASMGTSQTAALNIGIAKVVSTSNSYIENGATVEAGSVEVSASNTNKVKAEAGPVEIFGESKGITISDTQVTSNATAYIDTDMTIAGNIKIKASSVTEENNSSASAEPKSPVAGILEKVKDKVKSYLSKKKTDTDSGSSALDVSAGLALSENSINATAYIGSNAAVKSSSDINIYAYTEDNFQIFSASESEDAKVALSGAVAYGLYKSKALAYIADNAEVNASGTLEVKAEAKVSNKFDWHSFIPDDVWSGIKNYGLDFESVITEGIFNSYVRCASSPSEKDGKFGLAGSVMILDIEPTAEAYIGKSAKINQDTTYESSIQDVLVKAITNVHTINMGGVFSFGLNPLGNSGKVSVGGTYNQITYTTNTSAYIKDHALVSAKRNIEVNADSTQKLLSISVAGGSAEKFGVEGAVSIVKLESNTLAFIEDEANVEAKIGYLKVIANEYINNINVTGGFVKAENVGVGASVSINKVLGSTKAFIGNYTTDTTDPVVLGKVKAGANIEVFATSTQGIGSFSLAGVLATGSSSSGSGSGSGSESDAKTPPEKPKNPDAKETPTAPQEKPVEPPTPPADENKDKKDEAQKPKTESKGSFGLGISGDVALNTIDKDILAYIDGIESVDAGADLKISALNDSTIQAIAGSIAIVVGSKTNIGIAGSFTQNKIIDTTKAYVAHTKVDADGKVDISSKTTGDIKSICAGAAGGGTVGVAGSVAYNVIGNVTESFLSYAKINSAATLIMLAKDDTDISSIAGSLGFGKDALGFGASVGINSIANKTKTYLEYSSIDVTGDASIEAQNLNTIWSIVGSLGVSKAAGIAATMSWNEIGNETDVFISNCTVDPYIKVGGNLLLKSLDDADIKSISGAIGAGQKAAFGAGASYNEIANTVKSVVYNSTIKTTGNVDIQAVSQPRIKTIAVGGSGAQTVAIAGSVCLNEISDSILANVYGNSDITANNKFSLTATDTAIIDALSGAVAGAGTASVGAAVAINDIDNILDAGVSNSVVVADAQNLELTANSNATINSISVCGTGAGTFTIGGSVSLNEIKNTVGAWAVNSSDLKSKQKQVIIKASDTSTINSLAGSVQGAGTAAIGAAVATNKIDSTIWSFISDSVVNSLLDSVSVLALSEATIKTLSAGVAGSGTLTITGAVSLNKIKNNIYAYVKNTLATYDKKVEAKKDVIISAKDSSTIKSLCGQIGGSGSAAIGGSVAINEIANNISAYALNANLVSSSDNVIIKSTSAAIIETIAAGGSFGGVAGIAGSVAINKLGNINKSYIENSKVKADDSILVFAYANNNTDIYAGALAAGAVGVGGSVAVNDIVNTTHAYIKNSNATDDAIYALGKTPFSILELSENINGIGVYAVSNENVEVWTGTLSLGAFGVAGTNSTSMFDDDTQSYVENSKLKSDAEIKVEAVNKTYVDIKAGGLAIAGTIGIGATADITNISNLTKAFIFNNAVLTAEGLVEVKANAYEQVDSIVAAGGFSPLASVSGAVTIENLGNINEAYILGSQVNTKTDLKVLAYDSAYYDLFSNSDAVGLAGVGGAVVIAKITSNTSSHITDSTTNATHTTEVHADTFEEIKTLATNVNAGFLGAGGAVLVANIESITSAYINETESKSVKINLDPTWASDIQDVLVFANNQSRLISTPGVVSVGAIGAGASVDVSSIKNTVFASIGAGAEVDSGRNIEVKAQGNKYVDSTVLAFGGGVFGVQGAVSIINVGSAMTDKGSEASGTMLGAIDSDISGADVSSKLGSSSTATSVKSKIEEKASDLSFTDLFDTESEVLNSTTASIGESAKVNAGTVAEDGDITVKAIDIVKVEITSGAGALGAVGIGGAVGIASIYNNTKAFVEDFSVLNASDDILISADADVINSIVDSYAGAAGVVGLGAAVSYLNSYNNATAYVGEVDILKADAVDIIADSAVTLTAHGFGANFGALAAGVVISDVSEEGTTKAYIGNKGEIKNTGNVTVKANTLNTISAQSIAAAGGILAGNGSLSYATLNPTVRAYVGDNADIDIKGNFVAEAKAINTANAQSIGVVVAALGAGVSYAEAQVSGLVEAYTGYQSKIFSDLDISISALNNSYANASSTASAGALVGYASTESHASCAPEVYATLGEKSNIDATGDFYLKAQSLYNKAYSTVSGWCFGLAAFGSNTAYSTVNAKTFASMAKNVVVKASEILVDAFAVNEVYAYAQAGAGGLIAGTACETHTSENNQTKAFIDPSDINNTNVIEALYGVTVKAEEKAIVNAKTDSTSAGLVGVSGAYIYNSSDSLVNAFIGKNNTVIAGLDVNVLAINKIDKPNIGVNLSAGAGGIYGGAAGESYSYLNTNTTAYIDGNKNADEPQYIFAKGDVIVLAENIVTAYEKGVLSAGGAISGANVLCYIVTNNYANSYVGSNAVIGAAGNVYVLSHAIAIVGTYSNTVTWGLASQGDGTAEVIARIYNDVGVKNNARITAEGEINIGAGEGLDDIQNYLSITADARSWVSGGIPLSNVYGLATLYDYSNAVIEANSQVRAGNDVNIHAFKGFSFVYGYARAKKKSYLFFGIPITIYSNGTRRSNLYTNLTVTIDGSVESGMNCVRNLFIDENGVVSGDIGYQRLSINLLERLDAKIAALQSKINEYDPNGDFDGSSSHANSDILNALYTEKDFLVSQRPKYIGMPDVGLISVNDVKTTSGDINIAGTLSGTGYLKAPGNNFLIQILNDSLLHLEVNNLEIPESSSGKIILNGRAITTYPNLHIDPGENLGSRIIIINLVDINDPIRIPDPSKVIPSDIVLKGDIINYGGSVFVLNNSGSIMTSGNISAAKINIETPNGSFIHEYSPGLYHAGNTISGDNIYISAEILDINGTIQSGLPYRYVTIEEFDPETDLYSEYDGGPKKYIPITGDKYAKAVWDAENNRIILYRLAFKGGSVELFGEIVSTTTLGKIKVMDGYGEIIINNKSSRDIVVSTLEIGERIAGKIKITDTGIRINDFPRIMNITAEGDDLRVITGYRQRLTDGTWKWNESTNDLKEDTRSMSYDPYLNAKVADFGNLVLTYKDVQEAWNQWWDARLTSKNPFAVIALSINLAVKNALLNAYGVKADNKIGIEFIGNTQKGILEVNNTGAGSSDIYINGNISNKYADVKISNAIGSIYNLSDTAVITAQNIYLSSDVGNVGTLEQAVNIDTLGGKLYAAAEKNINVEEVSGDLTLASVVAKLDARIVADGYIWNDDMSTARIFARGITLVSYNGGIGTLMQRFLIESSGGAVNSLALKGIYLGELTGDMYIGKIQSLEGDVDLLVPGGIIDYNFDDHLDDDTMSLLQEMAQELLLQDEKRIQDSIAEYKQQKKDEYLEAHRVDDNGTPFDPSDDTYDIPREEVLAWEYALTQEEEASFYEGLWSDDDMVNAKNVDTLPKEGSTEAYVEDPNIVGRNIKIVCAKGIGNIEADEVIAQKDIDEGNISREQRIILSMAEADDITYEGGNLIVSLKKDVDVQATGIIDIIARDHIYLGSEKDVNIDSINSETNDIRLKIVGNMVNSAVDANKANLIANNLILEAYHGAIGSIEKPLTMDLRNGIIHARATDNIYLSEVNGDINVGTIRSYNAGVFLYSATGNIIPATGWTGVNIIAAGPSLLSAPMGTIGMTSSFISPISVNINGGPLVLNMGRQFGLSSGFVNGEINPVEYYLPVLSPISYPSPLYPPGKVYYNGIKIWPASSNNAYYFTYLSQVYDSMRTNFVLPDLGGYKMTFMDLMSSADKFGPVYLYHPLVETDTSAFDAISLDIDAYRFIDGILEFSNRSQFGDYFEEDRKKKKQTEN